MIKTSERISTKGQLMEFGISEDGERMLVTVDGKLMADVGSAGKAPKHDYGAEYTHVVGRVLATVRDIELMLQARHEIWDRKESASKANVPGLDELRAALAERENYRDKFQRMMDDEDNDGVNPPSQPKANIDSLIAEYPRAALYIKADGYYMASNHHKASAGKKAMQIIAEGGDLVAAAEVLNNWLPKEAIFD